MTRAPLHLVQAPVSATIREVIEVVDRSATAVALLVDGDGRMVGLLTDGDVRRALLKGATLEDAALPFASKSPHTVSTGSSRAHVLDLMRALRITAVPEIDDDGRVTGLHTLSDVVGPRELPNLAVVMAGGRGTRLGHLTRSVPKPLMEVAGRSILEWVVLTLVGGGIREVYVSVNHLADQVEEHLGDGARLGCRVRYLREEPDRPLGTAGSLSLLAGERPDLRLPLVVMNADLMVQFDPGALIDAHLRAGATVTVATRTYSHDVPYGVVEAGTDGRVRAIREKPTLTADVNAGIYAVSPEVLGLLEPGRPDTMPGLVDRLLERGEPVASWALTADWIDVGTPVDLARAKGEL